MRTSRRWALWLATAAVGATAQNVPTSVNYQGRLTDNTPQQAGVNGTVPMAFTIWDDPSAGVALWREPASGGLSVPVTGGIFNIALGVNGVPLPASVFSGANSTRYLEITLNPGAGNEEVLAPRQRISASAYAGRAQRAADSEALGGVAAASWQRALATPDCPPGEYLSALQPDGSRTCATSAGSSYTNGAGLSLVGNQFSVTAPLPVNLGGTGTTATSWVDLSTAQTVAGAKSFSSAMEVSPGLAVGSAYFGVSAPPVNGAIVQGNTGIGIANPLRKLHVVGDVQMVGDFVNQDLLGAHTSTVQSVPFTNGVITPLTGTTVSITIPDGNGVDNSGVLIVGGARIFGGTLNGSSSSLGGYFLLVERDTNPAFSGATVLTYTSGDCYIRTPNGAGSAPIGYGGGGTIVYVDNALVAGTTYYYRLSLYPNGVAITSGTYDVYQRDLAVVQIKR